MGIYHEYMYIYYLQFIFMLSNEYFPNWFIIILGSDIALYRPNWQIFKWNVNIYFASNSVGI